MTRVAGNVIDLFGGSVQIDITGARIVGAGGASPAPAITVGCRVAAQVLVPAVQITTFPPPPLVATIIVVTPAQAGTLTGVIQAVDAAQKSFVLLFRTVQTDASTQYSGETDAGPVNGFSDLAAGEFAVAQVVTTNAGGLLATRVEAHGRKAPPPTVVTFRGVVKTIASDHWVVGDKNVVVTASTRIVGSPAVGDTVEVVATADAAGILTAVSITKIPISTTRLITFRGVVQAIGATQWTVDSRTVPVDSSTKIVGDPKVGDTVEVVEEIQDPPPGSAAPTVIRTLSIVKVSTPPGPTPVDFTGVVTAISSPSAGALAVAMGHWTIGGRDVLVTGLTKISGNPKIGDTVEVKGYIMPGVSSNTATVPGQIVATSIEKR